MHSAARGRDVDELPRWAAERGFDAGRLAGWGWSMGGFGVLHIAEVKPGFLRGAAAFSPAVTPGDGVFASIGALAGTPLGVWCGRDDPPTRTCAGWLRRSPSRRASSPTRPARTPASTGTA